MLVSGRNGDLSKGKRLKESCLWGIGILLSVFLMMSTVLLSRYPEVNMDMEKLLSAAEFQNYTISEDGILTSETNDPIIIIPTETGRNVKAVSVNIREMSGSSDSSYGQIFFAGPSVWQEKGILFKRGVNDMIVSAPLSEEALDYIRVDLCETPGIRFKVGGITLNSKGALIKHSFMGALIVAVVLALLIFALYCYKDKQLRKQLIVQICIYIYSISLVFLLRAVPSINDDYVLKILTCIFSYIIGRDLYVALIYYKQHCINKHTRIVFCFSSLIIAFSLVGNDYFYNEEIGYFETSIVHILKYCLVCVYSLAICITTCYWLACKNFKNSNNSNKSIYKNVFLIFITSGLIYLIAYNPANMFPDTYLQLRQALGLDPLYDWHPVFHTLILKFFISVFKTPFVFAIFHIILFSYVMAKWMTKLHSKGLNKILIYSFSCTFYFNIAYGLLITNIWKDNLYNTCLIWCTYLLYEIIDDFELFNENKYNYISLFFSIIGIFFFMHNGIIPIISVVIFLIVLSAKQKNNKNICVLYILLIGIVLAKGPLYNTLNVIPNKPGVTFTPLVHDIASVIVYNNGNTLSDNVIDGMESILNFDQWKQNFDATDSDPYTYHVDSYMKNLNMKSTKEIAIIYLNSFKNEPLRIIGARLMSSQIMWSTFKRIGSIDYLYEKNNTFEIQKEFGYTRKENALTELFNGLYNVFENSKILNTIFFRTGIWFCVLIISITTVIVYKKSKKLLVVLIPLVSNMVSLAISMTCQHLRYVWALYIISILFLFVVIIDKCPKENTYG